MDPVDDLARLERGVPAELRRLPSLPLVPRVGPVVEARALDRLAVLAQVEPALAVAQPGVAEIDLATGDRSPPSSRGRTARIAP